MKTVYILLAIAVLATFVGRSSAQQLAVTESAQAPSPATDQVRLGDLLEKSKGNLVISAGSYEFGGTLEIDLSKFGALSLRADGSVTRTFTFTTEARSSENMPTNALSTEFTERHWAS